MHKVQFGIVLTLIAAIFLISESGCQTFRNRSKNEPQSKSHVIKRDPEDASTMEGWVGSERPSF